jgi:hypothetical protein
MTNAVGQMHAGGGDFYALVIGLHLDNTLKRMLGLFTGLGMFDQAKDFIQMFMQEFTRQL